MIPRLAVSTVSNRLVRRRTRWDGCSPATVAASRGDLLCALKERCHNLSGPTMLVLEQVRITMDRRLSAVLSLVMAGRACPWVAQLWGQFPASTWGRVNLRFASMSFHRLPSRRRDRRAGSRDLRRNRSRSSSLAVRRQFTPFEYWRVVVSQVLTGRFITVEFVGGIRGR